MRRERSNSSSGSSQRMRHGSSGQVSQVWRRGDQEEYTSNSNNKRREISRSKSLRDTDTTTTASRRSSTLKRSQSLNRNINTDRTYHWQRSLDRYSTQRNSRQNDPYFKTDTWGRPLSRSKSMDRVHSSQRASGGSGGGGGRGAALPGSLMRSKSMERVQKTSAAMDRTMASQEKFMMRYRLSRSKSEGRTCLRMK